MFKNISSGAAIIGAASAASNIHIDIDVNRIQDTVDDVTAWAEVSS